MSANVWNSEAEKVLLLYLLDPDTTPNWKQFEEKGLPHMNGRSLHACQMHYGKLRREVLKQSGIDVPVKPRKRYVGWILQSARFWTNLCRDGKSSKDTDDDESVEKSKSPRKRTKKAKIQELDSDEDEPVEKVKSPRKQRKTKEKVQVMSSVCIEEDPKEE